MTERDPNVVLSKLSRSFTWDGVTVEVEIYRLDDTSGWALEVVNQAGTSTVWDDTFETDREAYEAFQQVIAEEGIDAFLDDDDTETLH